MDANMTQYKKELDFMKNEMTLLRDAIVSMQKSFNIVNQEIFKFNSCTKVPNGEFFSSFPQGSKRIKEIPMRDEHETNQNNFYSREEFNHLALMTKKNILETREIMNVKADGHCLYRAISLHIFDTEEKHYKLRHKINSWALEHLNLFITEGMNREIVYNYFLKQLGSSEYGESESIKAASLYLKMHIFVWANLALNEEYDSFKFLSPDLAFPIEKRNIAKC